MERNCIFTRTGKGGIKTEQTNNLVAAIFQHSGNRNLDPNLHSHCVIFNVTQGKDDKWRSMNNREIYVQKITIGMVYHHELSQGLMNLGYEINWDPNGIFEVARYQPQTIEDFSSRKTEIIEMAGMNSSAFAREQACLATLSLIHI